MVLIYRCVADEERHLSLGVISFIVRALGSIPGPLITGAVFDSTCILRQELQEGCGLTGNCLVYDNEALAVRNLFMLLIGMSISSTFAFFVWLFYPKKSQVNDKEKATDNHQESNNDKQRANDSNNEQASSSTNGQVSYTYLSHDQLIICESH